MNLMLRVMYALGVASILVIYNFITSFVSQFAPRTLRRKKNIKGQRILITGAGSGVGRALAIEFSKLATCLILVDIDKNALLQTEKLLDRCSVVFIYDCDVSDYKKVYEMAKKVQKDAGDVDILVNNAGIVTGKFLWDLPEEKIVKTMEVNVLAHFWTCKAFLPAMMEKNQGHIVSIVSIGGKIAGPQLSDYCASKHAVLGFAESLETELRLKKLNGIKVTTVCPYFINTNLFKGADGKITSKMSPEYVGKVIVEGVLQDEEMIVLPNYLKFAIILKECVPRWITISMHEMLGTINLMDNFIG